MALMPGCHRTNSSSGPSCEGYTDFKEGMKRSLLHYRLWLSGGTKQDLNTWETLLQSYNDIMLFRNSCMMTTLERGIQLSTSHVG